MSKVENSRSCPKCGMEISWDPFLRPVETTGVLHTSERCWEVRYEAITRQRDEARAAEAEVWTVFDEYEEFPDVLKERMQELRGRPHPGQALLDLLNKRHLRIQEQDEEIEGLETDNGRLKAVVERLLVLDVDATAYEENGDDGLTRDARELRDAWRDARAAAEAEKDRQPIKEDDGNHRKT